MSQALAGLAHLGLELTLSLVKFHLVALGAVVQVLLALVELLLVSLELLQQVVGARGLVVAHQVGVHVATVALVALGVGRGGTGHRYQKAGHSTDAQGDERCHEVLVLSSCATAGASGGLGTHLGSAGARRRTHKGALPRGSTQESSGQDSEGHDGREGRRLEGFARGCVKNLNQASQWSKLFLLGGTMATLIRLTRPQHHQQQQGVTTPLQTEDCPTSSVWGQGSRVYQYLGFRALDLRVLEP